MKRSRALALLTVLVLVAAACGRSDSPAASSTASTASSSAATAQSRLDAGSFGDITNVCRAADGSGQKASGSTAPGVTDTEIHVGTLTDKGSTVKNGLTKEMFDAAVAFTTWCNKHGGILGRTLVLDDLDAKLFNYNDAITAACGKDFALVGGGAVFDDTDNGAREQCNLPNIAGYVVSAKARVAGLQVEPVPNPVDKLPVGQYLAINNIAPDALSHFGILTGNFPSTQLVRDQDVEGIGLLGGTVVYNQEYNATGESNWAPFVDDLKSKGVRAFEFVGEPENLEALQTAMSTAGYFPDVTMQQTNFYDTKYVTEGGANAKNTYIRSAFFPLELSDQSPATADYIKLMKEFNPSGKVAQLGVQGTSAWLLFAQAATACGSQLTAQCLIDKAKVTGWTGAGLHAATDPATNTPPNCFLLIKLDNDKFVYDETDTKPNQGKFNCDAKNLVTLTTSVPK